MNNPPEENKSQIALIDVVYGVVLGYGFNALDQASDPSDYVRFAVALAVVVSDWLVAHRFYRERGYSVRLFVLDIAILFVIARLLKTSVDKLTEYFLWFAILFALYALWDFLTMRILLDSGQNWLNGIFSDTFVFTAFAVLWLFLSTGAIADSSKWGLTFAASIFSAVSILGCHAAYKKATF